MIAALLMCFWLRCPHRRRQQSGLPPIPRPSTWTGCVIRSGPDSRNCAACFVSRDDGGICVARRPLGLGRDRAGRPGKENSDEARDRMLAGSIGKTYFSAVALQLVAEGKLELDSQIKKWLGSEPWFDRLPNDDEITLRMLMNHTSGVPEHVLDPAFIAAVQERAGQEMVAAGTGGVRAREDSRAFPRARAGLTRTRTISWSA